VGEACCTTGTLRGANGSKRGDAGGGASAGCDKDACWLVVLLLLSLLGTVVVDGVEGCCVVVVGDGCG